MKLFEKILYLLQDKMTIPKPFGLFHMSCISISILILIYFHKKKKYYGEKELKGILAIYGVVSLILEILKQLIWAFNYDIETNIVSWDYEWYAFPFQLCTTPIFISIICLFLKDNKIRDSLLSYMAFITILGGITTILFPESCFTEFTLVNIHTMWLHLGSFTISVYLLMSGVVKTSMKSFKGAIFVFWCL